MQNTLHNVSLEHALGEDIALRLMLETLELEEEHKIKTTPGRYFIDAAKREAQRQRVDLGFRHAGVKGSPQQRSITHRSQGYEIRAYPGVGGWAD
jgi:hypothetical protein